MKFEWAPQAYKLLNGVFCIYKPVGLPMHKILETIRFNLIRDLNALPCYKYEKKQVQPDTDIKVPVVTSVPIEQKSLIDHRLVLGQRFIPSDININFLHGLSRHSSGVLVLGIGKGTNRLPILAQAQYLRVYHVQGKFGMATENYTPKGSVLSRTTYHHITKPALDKICAAAQGDHQKHMFEYAGVDPESQEAYELASEGIVRPQSRDSPPMIYGVKCIDFSLPDFTLEIHSINESTNYIQNLIHDIALRLKSTAVCSHVRRIRHGYFTLEHSLLRKHWTLEHILENMQMCQNVLTPEKLLTSPSVKKLQGDTVKKLTAGRTSVHKHEESLSMKQVHLIKS